MSQPGSKDGSGSTLASPAAGGAAPASPPGHSKNQLEMLELVQRGMTMIPFNAYLGIDVTEVGVGLYHDSSGWWGVHQFSNGR